MLSLLLIKMLLVWRGCLLFSMTSSTIVMCLQVSQTFCWLEPPDAITLSCKTAKLLATENYEYTAPYKTTTAAP